MNACGYDSDGVKNYFIPRIKSKGFTEVLTGFTETGSWATATCGSKYYTVTTDGPDALRLLYILVKDMEPLED